MGSTAHLATADSYHATQLPLATVEMHACMLFIPTVWAGVSDMRPHGESSGWIRGTSIIRRCHHRRENWVTVIHSPQRTTRLAVPRRSCIAPSHLNAGKRLGSTAAAATGCSVADQLCSTCAIRGQAIARIYYAHAVPKRALEQGGAIQQIDAMWGGSRLVAGVVGVALILATVAVGYVVWGYGASIGRDAASFAAAVVSVQHNQLSRHASMRCGEVRSGALILISVKGAREPVIKQIWLLPSSTRTSPSHVGIMWRHPVRGPSSSSARTLTTMARATLLLP